MAAHSLRIGKIAAIKPEIDQLCKGIVGIDKDDQDGRKKIVQVAERILKLLKDNDLSYIMKIKSRFVGFHRRNRYGDGINAIDAIDLIKEIFDVGFSRTMVKPMCFEISAADTETHSINNYVAEAASGMLAPCPIGSLKFASVGCGHTNQGIRAIDAECMCDSAPEMTMDGKFNLDKIKAADPNLADAVIEGLEWLVICSEVEEAFPELPEILQEALNIMNQLARPESELQIMCKMHSMARSLQTLNECIDWAAIVAKCSRSKPRCSEDLHDIAKYVAKFAGGTDGVLLNNLRSFVRAHAPSKRRVRGVTFAAFASLPPIGSDGSVVPAFVCECMKAIYTAPSKFVKNDVCTMLSPQDIAEIAGKHKPHVVRADGLLRECRKIIESTDLKNNKCDEVIGILGSRLVMHVFQKVDASRKAFKSLEAIAHQAILDLKAALVAQKVSSDSIVSPWADSVQPPTVVNGGSNDASKRTSMLAAYDDAGVVVDPLRAVRELGFVENVLVHVPTDSAHTIYEIKGFEYPNVVLRVQDAGGKGKESERVLPIVDLEKTCKIYRCVDVELADWAQYMPCDHIEMLFDIWKGKFLSAMVALVRRNRQLDSSLRLMQKPSKRVFATEAFPKGQLELVPLTNVIVKRKDGSQLPAAAVDLGKVLKEPSTGQFLDVEVYLTPKNIEPKAASDTSGCCAVSERSPWVAPFWWVQPGGKANMTIVSVAVETRTTLGHGKTMQKDVVMVPVMQNSKAISKGDELIIARADKDATLIGNKRAMLEPTVQMKKPKGKGKGGR